MSVGRPYAAEVLRDGPVLYLRLGESSGTTAEDSSGNNLDGTYQNTPTLGVTGALIYDANTAVTLGGLEQHLTVPDSALLDPGDNVTLEGWINPSAFPCCGGGCSAAHGIFDKGSGGYMLWISGRHLKFGKRDGGAIVTSTIAIELNEWSHVVATKMGSTVKLYINGVDVTGPVTDKTIVASSAALTIGYLGDLGTYFYGTLDELAIYPSALSAARVYAHYLAGQESPNDIPIYAAVLENADGLGVVHRFATSTPANSGVAWGLILIPGNIEREVDPRESRFNTASLTFGLLDISGAATAVINDIIGRKCTFYTLDYREDWADRVALFTGIVEEFSLSEQMYSLTVRSPIVMADKVLFSSGRTKVQTGIGTTDTAVLVEDASALQTEGVIIIDDERIGYSGLVDSGATWTIQNLQRGLYGSTAASHAAEAAVIETFILEGHPFDIFAAILSGDATTKTGLGMSDYVNTAHLAAQKAAIGSAYTMFFEVTEPENGKAWLEREICKATGSYPFDNNEGKISVKIFSTAGTTVGSIADSDSLKRATWVGNFPLRVNHVTYFFDYDPVEDEFQSSRIVKDMGLIALYGEISLVIESKGLHSDLAGFDDFIDARGLAYIQRFGLELPTIHVETLFRKRFLQAADNIATTFSHLVNVTVGEIGLSNSPAELISVRTRLRDGRVEFVLISHQPIFDVLAPDALSMGVTSWPTVTVA